MRPQRPIDENAKESLRALLRKSKTKADFQRIQCIWLRATFAMNSDEVALAGALRVAHDAHSWHSQHHEVGHDDFLRWTVSERSPWRGTPGSRSPRSGLGTAARPRACERFALRAVPTTAEAAEPAA